LSDRHAEPLRSGAIAKKTWNNYRNDFATFFEWCSVRPRAWIIDNPVKPVPQAEAETFYAIRPKEKANADSEHRPSPAAGRMEAVDCVA